MGVTDPPQATVPWNKLLLWVQQQMAHEMETGTPAALSRQQLEALSLFVSFNDEPDVGDRDYVSLLLQNLQARSLDNVVFEDQPPVQVPIRGRFLTRWQCVCTIGQNGAFPRLGFGLEAGQQAPVFQSKKHAKQYAAKHAVAFLSQQQPQDAGPKAYTKHSISLPPISLPPLAEALMDVDSSTAKSPPAILANMPPMMTTREIAADAAPAAVTSSGLSPDKASSVLQQVSQLTERLGLGSPSYRIEPDPVGHGFFRGCPVFKVSGLIPPGMGVVEGVQGEAQTRQLVAERVLVWAEAEQQKQQEFETLWLR